MEGFFLWCSFENVSFFYTMWNVVEKLQTLAFLYRIRNVWPGINFLKLSWFGNLEFWRVSSGYFYILHLCKKFKNKVWWSLAIVLSLLKYLSNDWYPMKKGKWNENTRYVSINEYRVSWLTFSPSRAPFVNAQNSYRSIDACVICVFTWIVA